jgi:hypothetical protein
VRASKKLRNDELLVTAFAGTSLRRELDRIPLWRGNHVGLKQLAEDFARYVYLPRLADPAVLFSAVRDGLGLLTWDKDSFAYADDFDEKAGRYRGLRHGQLASLSLGSSTGLLVRPEIAKQQLESETRPRTDSTTDVQNIERQDTDSEPPKSRHEPSKQGPRRFHGGVTLDPTRVGRDAGRIADEIVSHLTGLMGSASPSSSCSAITVAALRAPGGRPRGLPERPFRNGRPRCCFRAVFSATMLLPNRPSSN